MKKLMLTLLAIATAGLFATGCSSSTEETEIISPEDLKPPMGLVSFAGSQEVTLSWDSANSAEDEYAPTSFTIYMAEGDHTASECAGPTNKYQLSDNPDAVPSEDLAACPDLGPLFDINGDLGEDGLSIEPAARVDIADVTVPGPVSYTLANGDPVPDLSDESAEAAADDETADEEASLYASAATMPGDSTDTTPPDDTPAGSGEVEIANGTVYTFFVTVRTEDDTAESFTSNWVAEAPRPQTDDFTLGLDDCYDLDALDPASAVGCSGSADVEISGWGLTGARPRFLISGANGAEVMDAGAVNSFDDVGMAPAEGYTVSGGGLIVRPGHIYVVATNGGLYGKIYIKSWDNTAEKTEGDVTFVVPTSSTLLTVQSAVQPTEGVMLFK